MRPPDANDAALPAFLPPESAGSSSTRTALAPTRFKRSIERDLVTNEVVYSLISEGGDLGTAAVLRIEEIDLELGHTVERHFRIDEQDPLSASTEIIERMMLRRREWEVQVRVRTRLNATREQFILRAWLTAHENGKEVFARQWEEQIDRDLL